MHRLAPARSINFRCWADFNDYYVLFKGNIYSDYNVYSVTPTYVHNFDPRNAGVFAVQAQRYDTTGMNKSTNDTVGPSIGWIAALTPDLTAKATGGFQEAKQSGGNTLGGDTVMDAAVYLLGRYQLYGHLRDTVSFLASRSEYPLGNGLEGSVNQPFLKR